MFTLDNTAGFTQADLDLLNQAAAVLIERGVDEKNAADIVNNNWHRTLLRYGPIAQQTGNTVKRLAYGGEIDTERLYKAAEAYFGEAAFDDAYGNGVVLIAGRSFDDLADLAAAIG